MSRFSGKKLLLPLLSLVLLVAFALLLRAFLETPGPSPPTPVPSETVPRATREVTLYFGAADASHLVAETREMEDCGEEQACLRAVIQALVAGPAGPLMPVLPPQAGFLDVRVEGSLALVDFSQGLIQGHPGGSTSELLTVYALADTLAANFPHIRQLRVLVEGAPVETLKGHVDLRQPITADFGFARSPEPAGAGAAGRNE